MRFSSDDMEFIDKKLKDRHNCIISPPLKTLNFYLIAYNITVTNEIAVIMSVIDVN